MNMLTTIKGTESAVPDTPAINIPPSMIRGLDYAFLQVREFHKSFDQPLPPSPTMQPLLRAMKRGDWIREECDELDASRTKEDQADAYIDILYFALGGLVEMGIMPQSLLDIVHHANMGNLHTIDGVSTVVKNEFGKVIKPDGWVENFEPQPRIAAEISRQEAAGLLSLLTA